jgi:hypothetical protein
MDVLTIIRAMAVVCAGLWLAFFSAIAQARNMPSGGSAHQALGNFSRSSMRITFDSCRL